MHLPREDNQRFHRDAGVHVKFSENGTFLASVEDDVDEALQVPESVVQRCGVLTAIRDQDDESHHEVTVEVFLEDAKSWLLCAALGSAAELATQTYETLLGALKVSKRNPTSAQDALANFIVYGLTYCTSDNTLHGMAATHRHRFPPTHPPLVHWNFWKAAFPEEKRPQ